MGWIAYEPIHFPWTTSKKYQPLTNGSGSQFHSSPQVGPPVSLQDQLPFSLPFASAAGGGWSGTSEFVMYRSQTMFRGNGYCIIIYTTYHHPLHCEGWWLVSQSQTLCVRVCSRRLTGGCPAGYILVSAPPSKCDS